MFDRIEKNFVILKEPWFRLLLFLLFSLFRPYRNTAVTSLR